MDNSTARPIEGYPKLACHMAHHSENAMFRRFSSLGTRNLLYLQAELVHLEQKLCRLEAADKGSADALRARYSRDWYWLKDSAKGESAEQMKTVLAIRSKLKEYYDAVVQQSVITRIAKPDDHDLRVLQDWLERPPFGNFALIGADSEIWGRLSQPLNPHADLLTLNSPGCEDSFSRWFSQKFVTWLHYTFRYPFQNPGDSEFRVAFYSSRAMERCTSFVTTTVASLLPILSTVVLYFASSMKLRLGLSVLFALLFTICISSLTSAKRGEIFIATSAFAAVQVVFISSNNGWGNTL